MAKDTGKKIYILRSSLSRLLADKCRNVLVIRFHPLFSSCSGVDFIFAPMVADMYPSSHRCYVVPDGFDHLAEGNARPGHFRGVATIVTKLFGMVQPTKVDRLLCYGGLGKSHPLSATFSTDECCPRSILSGVCLGALLCLILAYFPSNLLPPPGVLWAEGCHAMRACAPIGGRPKPSPQDRSLSNQ